MSTKYFYRDLPVLTSFQAATDFQAQSNIPDDWWLVVSDVLGSTKAIEQGRYKQVNTVGVSAIVAVINVDRGTELPFIFGGDGASLAVPSEMEHGVRQALLGAQALARSGFGLDLRIGMIPARDLLAQNFQIKIAKYKVSNHVTQASFSGRGWEKAEALVKGAPEDSPYIVRESATIKPVADFSGFECRWQGIRSRNDHKICYLIQSMASTPAAQIADYQAVLEVIADIYGRDDQHHPLHLEQLALSLNPFRLFDEAKVRSANHLQALIYVFKSILLNLCGIYIFKKKIDTKSVAWSRYRQDLIDNSDYKKFDGMLKMVFDGTEEQASTMHEYLEDMFRRRRLVYGTHKAREALMTCLIFSYNQQHAHFVDGSDGGYALAAKEFKKRLKAFKGG